MTYRNFTIALIIGGLIAVLALLFGRRKDDDIEYPEQPEPLIPWWTYTYTEGETAR